MSLNINRSNERVVWILIIIAIWYLTGYYIRNKDIYHSCLVGVVENIETNGRDKSVVQIIFDKTDEVNALSSIKIKDKKILVGDSIHKPMFSRDYYIYRKNKAGKFIFLYKIKN